MKFTVSVEDAGFKRLIEGMTDALGVAGKRKALEAVAEDFTQREQKVFETHGVTIGHAWPPLSPQYAARKAKDGRGGGTLHLSGALERSLTQRSAKYSRRRFTENTVTMGTGDPVTHLHQRGTSERFVKTYRGKPLAKPRSAGRLPSRPVMFVDEATKKAWRDIVRRHLLGPGHSVGL